MFRQFHLRSYIVGLMSGIAFLVLVVGVKSIITPFSTNGYSNNRNFGGQERQRFRGENAQFQGGGMMNENRLQGIAERLNMTITELQTELDGGKTMQDIAQERGVNLRDSMGQGRDNESQTSTGSTSPLPPSREKEEDASSAQTGSTL